MKMNIKKIKSNISEGLKYNLKLKIKMLIVANFLLLADLVSKVWANTELANKSISVIDNFFSLSLAYNTGVSFSMFESLSYGEYVLSAVALIAGILILCWSFIVKTKTEVVGLSLIFSGALGNGIDRLINGHVIDFLDFYYGNWHYPTFNLADCYIFVGVAIILIIPLLNEKIKKK